MALTTCPDCGTEVSDRAVSCVKCGRPIAPPVLYEPRLPVASGPVRPTEQPVADQRKSIFLRPLGFSGVMLSLLGIAVVISVLGSIKNAVSPAATPSPQPTATPDPFLSMSVADHLKAAEKEVQALRAGGTDIRPARRHLKAIPDGSPETKRGGQLTAEVDRLEKRILARSAQKRKGQTSPRQGNPIDQLVRAVSETPYGPLFLSWRRDGLSALFSLNPGVWHAMSRSEKRQILDHLASLRTWDEAGVLNARFYVGASDIGRIRKSFLGEWEFVPGGSWEDQ